MIGIFDSGVGGLTVARAIEKQLPDLPLIYFGDIARAPYGSKSKATITEYAVENSRFLLGKGASIIVVACNSASASSVETLRAQFDVPILEVIEPAAHAALQYSPNNKVGIMGTRATIQSGTYTRLLQSLCPATRVYSQECPLLVPLVEENWLKKKETKMILKKYLHVFKQQQVDTLILGCTHYPILKKLIQHRIPRKTKVIDSSEEAAKHLADFLTAHPELYRELRAANKKSRYYVSDLTESAKEIAQMIFQRKLQLECL